MKAARAGLLAASQAGVRYRGKGAPAKRQGGGGLRGRPVGRRGECSTGCRAAGVGAREPAGRRMRARPAAGWIDACAARTVAVERGVKVGLERGVHVHLLLAAAGQRVGGHMVGRGAEGGRGMREGGARGRGMRRRCLHWQASRSYAATPPGHLRSQPGRQAGWQAGGHAQLRHPPSQLTLPGRRPRGRPCRPAPRSAPRTGPGTPPPPGTAARPSCGSTGLGSMVSGEQRAAASARGSSRLATGARRRCGGRDGRLRQGWRRAAAAQSAPGRAGRHAPGQRSQGAVDGDAVGHVPGPQPRAQVAAHAVPRGALHQGAAGGGKRRLRAWGVGAEVGRSWLQGAERMPALGRRRLRAATWPRSPAHGPTQQALPPQPIVHTHARNTRPPVVEKEVVAQHRPQLELGLEAGRPAVQGGGGGRGGGRARLVGPAAPLPNQSERGARQRHRCAFSCRRAAAATKQAPARA